MIDEAGNQPAISSQGIQILRGARSTWGAGKLLPMMSALLSTSRDHPNTLVLDKLFDDKAGRSIHYPYLPFFNLYVSAVLYM